MSIDPITAAKLVTREVRTGSRDGSPTKTTIARRTYPTDQADLWDVVTNEERLPRWFAPVSGELRLGGRYQIEGNASGVIEECDEPRSFALTWGFDGQVSWLRVLLTPADEGTTLEIAHEGIVDAFWDEFGPGAGGVGWDLALLGLGTHLATGAAVDPEEALTFTLTPEGIDLVRFTAAAWTQAAIGDGDDPVAANAAGQRTFAFYTTNPDYTTNPEASDEAAE